jgi:hypothetical protein
MYLLMTNKMFFTGKVFGAYIAVIRFKLILNLWGCAMGSELMTQKMFLPGKPLPAQITNKGPDHIGGGVIILHNGGI